MRLDYRKITEGWWVRLSRAVDLRDPLEVEETIREVLTDDTKDVIVVREKF